MRLFMLEMHKMLVLIMSLLTIFVAINGKESLIETDLNGLISAFGDFDSDKSTDVFLITENGKTLELAKGFITEPVLRKSAIKCSFNNTDQVIVGVIAADFSGKAMMDVMVVTKQQSQESSTDLKLWLLRGSIYNLDCNVTTPLVENVMGHPLVLDYNGDMIADLIVETKDCARQLWSKPLKGVFKAECLKELNPDKVQAMKNPNSNAFINLDPITKVMSPDIFISGKDNMEIWNDQKGYAAPPVYISYPQFSDLHFGQSAFVDINIDGHIDHIMPICKGTGIGCDDPRIVGFKWSSKEWVTISDLKDENNVSSLNFVSIETFNKEILPITVRHGDIDGDGYPDLITVMRTADNRKKAIILKNVKADNPFGRKFIIDWSWTSDKILSVDSNVEIVSFIDLFDDGKLDILLSYSDKGSHQLKVAAVVNTQMIAACFLKVLVTSGLCYGSSCPRGNIPYGTNQVGPHVCYDLVDTYGTMQTQCAGQLSQSGHFALQMPYSVFGLGDSPNFVESVFASIPSGKMDIRYSQWTQIVPDAQLVLIPYPPNDTNSWISKLFYTPSNIVFSTLITLASICCVLVLIIAVLHRKELLEDLAEHEEYKRHWPESR